MNNDAGEKIKMLKGSIRCLMFGLLGLVPVIGLPFGLAALWVSGQVRVREKIYWNAAKPYRSEAEAHAKDMPTSTIARQMQ